MKQLYSLLIVLSIVSYCAAMWLGVIELIEWRT